MSATEDPLGLDFAQMVVRARVRCGDDHHPIHLFFEQQVDRFALIGFVAGIDQRQAVPGLTRFALDGRDCL